MGGLARHRAIVVGAAIAVSAIACGDHDRTTIHVNNRDAQLVSRDSAPRALGPGDVQIASVDTSLEVGLYGDSLVMGFGRKIRDKIKNETDTTNEGSGFGASISKMVKGTVAKALNHELEFPISTISDIQYTPDRRLEFYDTSGKKMHMFESSSGSNDHASGTFAPDDAQRLIAAFKAKKGHP